MGCYRYQDVKTVPFEGLICLLWDVCVTLHLKAIDSLNKVSLFENVDSEYYLHPAIREIAKSRLKLDQIQWKRANIIAAKFWTNNIKEINTTNDAIKAMEAYHHYCAIEDYISAGNIICEPRDNNFAKLESLGSSFYRFGWFDSLSSSIFKIINDIKEPCLTSILYNKLGDIEYLSGNILRAIEFHIKCFQYATNAASSIEDIRKIIISQRFRIVSYFNIALCYVDSFDFCKARESLDFSLKLQNQVCKEFIGKDFEVYNLSKYEIYSLQRIKNYHENIKPFSFYIDINNENIDPYKTLDIYELDNISGSSWYIGYTILSYAITSLNINDFKRALLFYQKLYDFACQRDYVQFQVKALNGLCQVYRKENCIQKALNKNLESLALLAQVTSKSDKAEAYFQLGLTYQAMREHDQAEEYKAKALELFAQMEAPKQIERVNKAFGGNIP